MSNLKRRPFRHLRSAIFPELYPAIVEAFTPAGEKPALAREAHPGLMAFDRNVTSKGLQDVKLRSGPVVSYAARGYLGQILVVVPGKRLVAVRQRRATDAGDDNLERYGFSEFEPLVRELVPR